MTKDEIAKILEQIARLLELKEKTRLKFAPTSMRLERSRH